MQHSSLPKRKRPNNLKWMLVSTPNGKKLNQRSRRSIKTNVPNAAVNLDFLVFNAAADCSTAMGIDCLKIMLAHSTTVMQERRS